jgi:hypothetical protein
LTAFAGLGSVEAHQEPGSSVHAVRRVLLALGFVSACATPTLALEASKQVKVDATPDAAWAAIGEFCDIGLSKMA